MPKPRKGEKQSKFMSRCVSDVVGENKDRSQAVAICLSVWKEKGEGLEVVVREAIPDNPLRVIDVNDRVMAVYDTKAEVVISYLLEDYDASEAHDWVAENSPTMDKLVELAHKIYKEWGDT